jgi:FdrA protein
MTVRTLIKKSEYHDSVSLMLVAKELAKFDGIQDAAVVMATEANKGILKDAGLFTAGVNTTTPNDLVISVKGEADKLEAALIEAEKLLQKKESSSTSKNISSGFYQPKSLVSAIKANPELNLAVISVAGRFATAEAWDALQHGLHVLLFSDNISLEDEIALKQYAIAHGLLLMGPGAGTAILNGVALGFANVLPRGPVGIISAAGTGLQEVSTLLARLGVGISQGIGTGGRDLKEAVGGMMMLAGLQALQADPETQVLVVISKPPAQEVVNKVLQQVNVGGKSTVVCFLGVNNLTPPSPGKEVSSDKPGKDGVRVARTLEEAALSAAQWVKPDTNPQLFVRSKNLPQCHFHPQQRFLRALFSGGTLCYEAQVIWSDLLQEPVFSNAPLNERNRLADSNHSQGHTAIDLGEEEFTVGRPHPMIDNDLRIRRLLQEARDPETAIILFDVVLGHGAHPDPTSEFVPAVKKARDLAAETSREIAFIACVTGTEGDPQCRSRQVNALEQAGIIVGESNADAARIATILIPNGVKI